MSARGGDIRDSASFARACVRECIHSRHVAMKFSAKLYCIYYMYDSRALSISF